MKENTGAIPQLNTEQPPASTPQPLTQEAVNVATPGEVAPPRRPGAPLGNQNARVHGFYSKKAPIDRRDVMDEAAELQGLDAEIALFRSKIELLEEIDPKNVKLFSECLRTLSLVMVRRKYAGHNVVIEKARKLMASLRGAAAVAGDVAGVVEAFKE